MKTKRITTVIALLFITLSSIAQKEIMIPDFQDISIDDAVDMCKVENKIVVVEFMGTNTDTLLYNYEKVFTYRKVSDILSNSTIMIRYNPENDKKSKLLKKYSIFRFPTYVFLDKEKEVRYKISGVINREDFLNALNYALSDEENMVVWKKMIDGNEANSNIYFKYAKGLYLGGDDYFEAAAAYFNHSNTDFSKEQNGMEAVLLFTQDMYNPRFMLLMRNLHSADIQGLDNKFINKRINDIISNSLIQAVLTNNKIKLNDTLSSTIETFQIDNPFSLESFTFMKYYSFTKPGSKDYYNAILEYLTSSMFELDEFELYQYIKEIAKNCKDAEINRSAINIIMEMIAKNNKPQYQRLLIDLSVNTGDYAEAIHTIDVLEEENEMQTVYSKEELEALRIQIEKKQEMDKKEKREK
jgi:thioredoxin-related protein